MKKESSLERAKAAYYRWCKKTGCIHDQPSEIDSLCDEHNIITLSNCNGILARYRYHEDTDTLERLSPTDLGWGEPYSKQ